MNLSKLNNCLTHALLTMNMDCAYDCLLEFGKLGGEQFDAYELLINLSKSGNYDEDMIIELGDLISGWVSYESRIWEDVLGSRVCLYTVAAIEVKNNTVALLPGIEPDRIRAYNLGWVTQGVELELHYPDGMINKSTIANYYVNATQTFENEIEIRDERIVICLEDPKCVPLGTRIWCVRQG